MFSVRIAAALTTSRPVRRTPSVTVCRLPTQLMLLWLAFKKNRDQN